MFFQLKEIENENAELKMKLSSTESNVVIFVKEMSEMLDTHEVSTNNDSQELNFSNNSNNNEEPPEIDQNIKYKLMVKRNHCKKIMNGIKESKILLSQENLLSSKK